MGTTHAVLLAAPVCAHFTDIETAGAATVELVRAGTPPAQLLVGMRDLASQRAFAQRFAIGELARARRAPVASAIERLTGQGAAKADSSLADALIANGIASDTANGLDERLGTGVLLVVPDTAPAEALPLLVRYDADFGAGTPTYVIPVREERLELERRTVVEHEVAVRTEVITETRNIEVSLEREEFVIERRTVRADGSLGDAEETRVPLRHEEVVITKHVVPTAVVEVRRERHVDVTHLVETVAHEEVRVEADPGVPITYGETYLADEASRTQRR